MKSIQTALDLYKSDNGFYPTNIQGLKALIAKPRVSPLPKNYRSYGYLEKVPKDNWGNVFLYQYFGPPGNGVIIIRSRGKDGSIGGYGENRDQLLIYEDT
jgi:general secretion pathway protein G